MTYRNGTISDGRWFYDTWTYAVDSDHLFDDNDTIPDEVEADKLVNNAERNGFVRIYYHWSQDERKSIAWYEDQCRAVNFNKRTINQEYDLLFVGSTQCLFEDEFLSKLRPIKPVSKLKLPHETKLSLFVDEFDTEDFYIVGVDTAKSLTGDYNALEIFRYSDFMQVGELFCKLGSLRKYYEIIMVLTQMLAALSNDRVILAIENNSIGKGIIEPLEYGELDYEIAEAYGVQPEYDYARYIFTPTADRKKILKGQLKHTPKYVETGLNTNASTKGLMVSHLYDFLIEDPARICSSDLIAQLNVIEKRANGSVGAQHGSHDDLFMSCAMCAYCKRLTSLEYDKLIGIKNVSYTQFKLNQYRQALITATTEAPKIGSMTVRYNPEENGIEYVQESDIFTDNQKEERSDPSDFWGIV